MIKIGQPTKAKIALILGQVPQVIIWSHKVKSTLIPNGKFKTNGIDNLNWLLFNQF